MQTKAGNRSDWSPCKLSTLPTLHPDVSPGLAQHVGGGAAVVAKVLCGHLADEERVPVALLLHVPTPVRVQQHGVLVGKVEIQRKSDIVTLRNGKKYYYNNRFDIIYQHVTAIWDQ